MGAAGELSAALRRQSRFAAACFAQPLPPAVQAAAGRVLLDSLGVMAAGLRGMPLPAWEPGASPLPGRASAGRDAAVLFNGTAMVRYELDEGNQYAFGHPGCHVVPALLAAAGPDTPAPAFYRALVAGYELACRWSAAVSLRKESHVHGTAAAVGGAAAAALLQGANEEELYQCLLLAGSLPQTTSWQAAFHGDEIRNAYVGLAGHMALNALALVRAGITSSEQTLLDVWTRIAGTAVDPEALTAELGEAYRIEKNYFKLHSACRYTHAFAEFAARFLAEGHTPDEIEAVEIETYHSAAQLGGTRARNAFAARFSIPVSLAICLLRGSADLAVMTDANAAAPDVAQLAARVSVREAADLTALLPDVRANRMRVALRGGKTLTYACDKVRGDFSLPLTDEELLQKFLRLTEGIWPAPRQKAIAQLALQGAAQPTMAALWRVLPGQADTTEETDHA